MEKKLRAELPLPGIEGQWGGGNFLKWIREAVAVAAEAAYVASL